MAERHRSRAKCALLLALAATATLIFAALSVWQVERRAWKLALIEAVAQRIHAPPSPPPPGREATRERDEYRHVVAEGRLLDGRETFVQALTELGPGWWVMTPLRTASGRTILINCGFVPSRGTRQARPTGALRITGLLRISEPGGRFLRRNEPGADRWYSRDVDAIGRRRGVGPVAPYFIDADAISNPGGWPRGGLTVVTFPNNHLAYALTWFALSLLSAVGFVIVWRERP